MEASIEAYLKTPKLANSERAWALTEKAQALAKHGLFAEAKPLLVEAMALNPEPPRQRIGPNWLSFPTGAKPASRDHAIAVGTDLYWLGYCTWKLGDADEAEPRASCVAGSADNRSSA